jgi:hypothetical protein
VTNDNPGWCQFGGPALLNLEKNDRSHVAFFLMCHHLVWKFSSAISRVIQHPAIIPHCWLLSHSTIISLLWHLLLNRALKHHYVIIQSHMSLKLLILLSIMSPFEGTLSFSSLVSHTIIKPFITPKNLLFHLQ